MKSYRSQAPRAKPAQISQVKPETCRWCSRCASKWRLSRQPDESRAAMVRWSGRPGS